MVSDVFGKAFDSEKELGCKTVATVPLTPILYHRLEAMKPLVKDLITLDFSSDMVIDSGSDRSYRVSLSVEEVIKGVESGMLPLQFYSLESWEYIREKLWEEEIMGDVFYAQMRSHWDISTEELKKIIECGESALVSVLEDIPTEKKVHKYRIIETKIVYDNPVSKCLPMFLTEEGVYLWWHEVKVMPEKEVQDILNSGGIEMGSGEIALSLFEVCFIERVKNRGADNLLENEYNVIKQYIDTVNPNISKDYLAEMLYTLEDKNEVTYENFDREVYREYIKDHAHVYAGDFLAHYDRVLDLGK